MPRWRQKAVCRGNSGWCVRLPGSPVWKMPAFQTSPAPSANIPPSQPFFLYVALVFWTCFSSCSSSVFFPPRTFHSRFRGSPSHFAQKKKSYRCFDTSYERKKKKQASTQIRCFPIFSLFHLTERLIYIESFFSFFFFLQINSKWSYLMSSVFQIKMEALAALRQLKHQEMNEAQPDMYHLSLIMWIFI